MSKSSVTLENKHEPYTLSVVEKDGIIKSWFGRDMQEKLRDVFVKLDKKIIILLQKVNDLFKFRFSYWL